MSDPFISTTKDIIDGLSEVVSLLNIGIYESNFYL